MSDELQVKGNKDLTNDGGRTFLQDSNGDFSSGRLIKIICAIMAVAVGLVGLAALVVQKSSNPELAAYCFKVSGLFLATSTGSEIVQKVTGR